jgi:DNA-binding MarR family transcriptional regulator
VLARATLLHLDEHPGDSNVAIAEGVGIRLESQVSRHLKALEHAGLLQHEREGRRNRWALTPAGRVVAARLR